MMDIYRLKFTVNINFPLIGFHASRANTAIYGVTLGSLRTHSIYPFDRESDALSDS